MSEGKLFRPKAYPPRHPTETAKEHGRVVNPPRMSEIGGADKPHKAHKKNQMTLRKPGGTV